jgi:hypothetical protein
VLRSVVGYTAPDFLEEQSALFSEVPRFCELILVSCSSACCCGHEPPLQKTLLILNVYTL